MRPELCTLGQAHSCAIAYSYALVGVENAEEVIKLARDAAPANTDEVLHPTDRQTYLFRLAGLAVQQLEDVQRQVSRACVYCPLAKLADVTIPNILENNI